MGVQQRINAKTRSRLKPAIITSTVDVEIPYPNALYGGVVVGNLGAAGAVVFKLPKAVPGMRIHAIVEAAQALRLDPQDTEIVFSTAGVTNTAGKYIGNATVGSYLHLIALRNGAWKVEAFAGTWASEA